MSAAAHQVPRPMPPATLLNSGEAVFAPAPDVWTWAHAAFVAPGAPLSNQDHRHLRPARIGVLWTNVPNTRQMRRVVGMAEAPHPPRTAWGAEALAAWLCDEWFGPVDFRLYFDAAHAATLDALGWCALVEHELYHCGQRRDRWGAPRFSRSTGRPVYGLRGHDAEEHVGIVRRYGAGAAAAGVRELVEAAARPPEIAAVKASGVCGTCLRLVA